MCVCVCVCAGCYGFPGAKQVGNVDVVAENLVILLTMCVHRVHARVRSCAVALAPMRASACSPIAQARLRVICAGDIALASVCVWVRLGFLGVSVVETFDSLS